MRMEKFKDTTYMHPSHQRATDLGKTWQRFSLDEYTDKIQRDSGAPSTLPEPPPPPTPKARPPEKGQGKSEPSGWSSSGREDSSFRNQNQWRWNNSDPWDDSRARRGRWRM
eukprot:2846099-Pyramimonas_sp.AAC.1